MSLKPRTHAPLNIAIAGAGMISWHHLVAWRSLGDRIKLVAICDPDRAKAQARTEEFSIARVYETAEELLGKEEIDALDVASPRETHAAWVDAAAARGIDVLCQKPMTPTLAESVQLTRRVDGKCRLMVHENWRFRPWYRDLKAWISSGALGDLIFAKMSMITSGLLPDNEGKRPSLVRQPFMQFENRLMIAEVLIHHIDTMRYLCGDMRVIGARVARTLEDVVGETSASIFLETAEGRAVEVCGTMAAAGYPSRPPDRLEIIGTNASVLFAEYELRLFGEKPSVRSYDGAEGYQASFNGVIAHFIDCLASGAQFETGPADNLETLRLVEHAYWAAGRHDATR